MQDFLNGYGAQQWMQANALNLACTLYTAVEGSKSKQCRPDCLATTTPLKTDDIKTPTIILLRHPRNHLPCSSLAGAGCASLLRMHTYSRSRPARRSSSLYTRVTGASRAWTSRSRCGYECGGVCEGGFCAGQAMCFPGNVAGDSDLRP